MNNDNVGSGSGSEFSKDLEGLLNKYGVDKECDVPDFILSYQVITLLNGIRIANILQKQWEGDNK